MYKDLAIASYKRFSRRSSSSTFTRAFNQIKRPNSPCINLKSLEWTFKGETGFNRSMHYLAKGQIRINCKLFGPRFGCCKSQKYRLRWNRINFSKKRRAQISVNNFSFIKWCKACSFQHHEVRASKFKESTSSASFNQ